MPSQERLFAESFAGFVGRRYGVSCSSGTAALTIALQALGIGPGDEVVVPGLTWVACASAVVNLGGIPVLVDVDPDSLCASIAAIEAGLGARTRAVLGVHMYASRADLPALETLCASHNLSLIEDASQAHGATIGNRRAGTFGSISIFSFQQSKLLTAGEGGIAVTDDDRLFQRMQQLRADGRAYAGPAPMAPAFSELVACGEILGRNLCLSEFQAVLLQEGLGRLDVENAHRLRMATVLEEAVGGLGWVSVVRDRLDPRDGATFYKIPLRIEEERLLRIGPELLARALTAELRLPVEPLDWPLNRSPLYRPETSPLVARNADAVELFRPGRFSLPQAEAVWRSSVALPHPCLMGGEIDVQTIATALRKIHRNADALEDLSRRPSHGAQAFRT